MQNQNAAVLCFQEMLRIRMIEETIGENYARPGQPQELRSPTHRSIGQEATIVGVCSTLKTEDVVVSTHRCHVLYQAKGGSLRRMVAERFGKVDGCTGGRGGSKHLSDDDGAGLLASIPIAGASMPIPVGTALSFALEGAPHVAAAFVGNPAMKEGSLHESANFASLNKLAVRLMCENVLYSVYTPLHYRHCIADLTQFARAHGATRKSPQGRCGLGEAGAQTSAMEAAIANEIADAFTFARQSPLPTPDTAHLHVYVDRGLS